MKGYVLLFLKGMAMGAADVVPGVSGGTIAFISGIYEELIESLRRMTPAALAIWYREGFAAFWRHINGTFLVVLVGGILLSVLSLAHIVTYCLEQYPLLVWGFFFGLVLASTIYIGRGLPLKQLTVWSAFIIGVLVASGISIAKPVQLPNEWWMAFIAGAIAICAMILPGISGSFILLLMGLYTFILRSLIEANFVIIFCFVAGCAVGLLAFSHVLSWLLREYHNATMALLTGFLLGSLKIVWPWKQTVETLVNRHGEVVPVRQENLLPGDYGQLVGGDPQTWSVIALAAIGLLLIFSIEYLAHQLRRRSRAAPAE
jgi:putative membrane protein